MKMLVKYLMGGLFFVNISLAARTDISLNPSDWMDNGTVTSSRTLTQTTEGYLRATCNAYRGAINYRTRDTYNFQGATVRYKWRMNCGANYYCQTYDGAYPWGRMSTQALTTNHSWASSIVISNNTWIYTEIHFNEDRTWSADYSYSGYGLGGINHNSGTITEANWNYLATSFISKPMNDGYNNSFYYEIAEAYAETSGPAIEIISPADGLAFDPNEPILFNATASGGTEPYQFSWTSDIDGVLGDSNSITVNTLSQGSHVITATCTDSINDTNQTSITVHIVVPPAIKPIANLTITDIGSYNGPVPVLTQGAMLVTWSLVEGPAGMTINPDTGQVAWVAPFTAGSPFAITIQAQNPKGADQASWQLEVIETPNFATTLWTDVEDGRHGVDGHDAYSRPAIDHEGNVIAAGYIDSTSGHQDAAYLVKYSPDGTVLWSKIIDAPSYSGKAEYNDRFQDVAVDSENNVIVVGTKSGNFTSYILGSYHTAWWVQKYTPDGQTLLWEKLWHDTASSAWQGANGVFVDAQDNVYVTGASFGSWGGPEHQWVTFKYDKNGNILLGPIRTNFVNAYYLPDYAYDIAADTNGDFYVAGLRGVSGSNGSIYNNFDWQVIKYNGVNGAILWQDTYAGPTSRSDCARGLALDGQGHLIVAGYLNKGSDNSTNINYDWLVIQYDAATGARLWTQTYESATGASEVCYDVVTDAAGDCYVGGYQQDAAKVPHRRIAKLAGSDGTTQAASIWQSDYSQYIIGLDIVDNLLAAVGVANNGLDYDAFISLLTVEFALRITEPAYNAWFELGTPVTFSAQLLGAAEPPYYYSWTSDLDGPLGTGHTLEATALSLGEHLVTCQLDYGTGQTMQTTVRVHIAQPPQITELENQTISDSQAYTGPIPVVNAGAGTVTWSLIENPDGMTINTQTGVVSWTNPVGSLTPYTVTIQTQNPLGSDQESWQISVLSQPQIEAIAPQTAMESTPFTSSAPVLLKGTEPVEWQLVTGPAGMTIAPATGVVSWDNPIASFSTYSVAIRAVNTIGSDNETFTLTVQSVPQIAEIADVTIIGGQSYTRTPALLKGVPAVQWSLLENPAGMTINNTTGQISWPNPGPDNSVNTVTVQAANIVGSDTKSYQIRVMQPPILDTLTNDTVHEGVVYSKSVSFSQGTSPLTFSLLSAPGGMSIISTTGEISWAYPNGNDSPYTVTVRLSNAVGTDNKSFTLTVLQKPVMKLIANALTAQGAAYTAPTPALYQGSAPITWSLVSGPAGMTVDENTGITTWPAAVYAESPYTVTIKAENVVGTDTKTWQVTVVQAPLIADYSDQIIGNNVTYTAPLPILTQGSHVTWSLQEAPTGMTINPSTGQIIWPNPAASDTPHTIQIKAANIAGEDTEEFQLSVLSLPQIEAIPQQTAQEQVMFTSMTPVLLKGTEPVTWQLVSGPAGMTIAPATGVVSWENPLPSFSTYSVTIRATNTVGSDNETFTITVQSVPQIATIADITIIGGQAYNLTPTLLKGVPAIEWSLTEHPEGMTINSSTGQINWPNPGPDNSTHTVTVQAANTVGSDTKSYQIRVMLPPILDTLTNDTVHEGIAYSKSVSFSQGTPPLTYSLLNAPGGLSINPSTGDLAWAYPNGNYSPYTVTVRLSNDVGTDTKSFTLTVLQRPVMKLIANVLTAQGAPYTAPTPALYQGSAPMTWSLVSGPAGMTVDENTGITSWPAPVYAESPHTVTIKAENIVGADTKTWQVTVVQTPVIAAYGDQVIGNSVSYIAPLPSLTQGSHITWSLEEAPTGMTINASTGQIVWSNPTASGTPYTIRIKATNIAGENTKEFQLTVLAKPVLANIENVSIEENRPFTSAPAQLLAGQPPVTFSLSQAPAGMIIDPNSGVMQWPRPTAIGSPHTIRLRAANAYGSDEKTFTVTVPVGYAADAWTDIEIASAGTPIPIQGHAYYLSDGTAIANVTIQLQIKVRNTTRIYTSQTDAQGDFEFIFQPLPQEAGLYSIHSGHPLQVPQTAQDTFILAAMRATDSKTRPSLIEGTWYETTVTLKNLGNTDLTNITAAKISGPNSIEIDFAPIPALPADSSQPVTLRMKAADTSVLQSVVSVLFSNDQQAESTINYSAQVIALTPQLAVYPKSLTAGMIRGQATNISFEVYNKGGKATPQLLVLVPDAEWLSMNNPENIGIHEPNDVTVVTLTLNPDASLPLGPYTGSIIVYGTDMAQTIPFHFNCISDQTGGLDIEAVDEFTYYAAGAPRVDDASITLREAFTGDIVYFNEPMTDGRLLLQNLPESYYNLEVQAPEHGRYSATLYVAPGVNSQITAFLPRQLVKYTWTVVPTEIEDKYTVTLDTTFETNVPAPVVVIEPANVDLSKMVNGQMQVNFTITNHGLVAAEDFHLLFDNHPRYQVQLLTDFNGRVGPNETIVVPALFTDLQFQPALAPPAGIQAAGGLIGPGLGECDPVTGGGYYTLVCGKNRKWHKEPIKAANWLCNLGNLLSSLAGGDDDYDPDEDWDDDDEDIPPGTWPEDTGSGKTPVGGGGTIGGGGGGVIGGGRTPGTSPRKPIIVPPTITTTSGGSNGCDPCPQALMEAMLECVWSFVPTNCVGSVIKGLFDCGRNCIGEDFDSFNCELSCLGSVVGVITSCGKDLTPVGHLYNTLACIYSLSTACNSGDAVAYQAAAADFETLTGLDVPNVMPASSDSLQFLMEQAQRLETIINSLNYVLGDPIWFSGVEGEGQILSDWMQALGQAMDPASDGGGWISPAELDVLRTMPLPSQITTEHVDAVCQRWNRSLDYWQAGKFKSTDLQPGDDPDFIATDISLAKFEQANTAVLANEAQGYFDLFAGVADGFDQLKVTLQQETKGVCAKVHLQIEQSAVITRSAFRATLDMENQSQVDSLNGIQVVLEITDTLGNQAGSLFGVYPPIVTGLPNVNGGGNLNPGRQFHAEWLLVPTLDAAPLAETQYLVGGSIQYTVNGNAVTFPIFPDTITVKPDANLHLKYFYEKDVYGDDPFTEDVIEPSVPFVLGLMVTNTGAGSAYNMTLTSAQPTIVRHEQDKDILIDFTLLDVNVDNAPRVPSLQVNIGNILPNSSKVTQWHMQCSLQGEFTNYVATFAHTDTLGEPKLSLIQSATTHQLIHAVRANRPQDDTVVDFLTNDIPDVNSMPDTLHLSEGTEEPVNTWLGDPTWLAGNPGDGSITLTMPQSPDGFFYVRLPNPGWPHFELKQVVRSDGITLPQENAWTTYRMNYPLDSDPYAEIYLHLFDNGGTGIYTLYYEAAQDLPPVVTDFEIADVMGVSETPLPLTVTFADNIGVDANSLDGLDILVSSPAGQTLAAEFVQILSQNGGSMTVQYQILPPDGLWEGSDNGLYSIQLAANQVADSAGQFAAASTLGGFLVSVPQCVDVEVISCDLTDQVRISRTEFDMTYTLTLKNHCNKPVRNLRVIPQEIPANLQLMSHDISFCYIAPNAQASSQGTFTVRMDYANPPDTLTQFQWRLIPYGPADVSMDGVVNIADLAQFAAAWLGSESCYDWAPEPNGDGRVDLNDFTAIADHWLQ